MKITAQSPKFDPLLKAARAVGARLVAIAARMQAWQSMVSRNRPRGKLLASPLKRRSRRAIPDGADARRKREQVEAKTTA
jgi:hypothetical protein